MWFRECRTKIQAIARPDHLWPEIWSGMSNAAQKKEKQEWTMEKPKLDNARRLRGICFIDPEDGEREKKEAIKTARKKLEILMEAAMACKTGTKKCLKKLRGTVSESDESNTKHAWIVEAHESTRKRLESTLPKDFEDHIAGTGYNSISHHILLHKFLPMPQAMQNSGCEGSSAQGMEEVRNDTSLTSGRDEEQNRCYCGSTKREEKRSTLLHTRFCSASFCIGSVRTREFSKQRTTGLFQIEDISDTTYCSDG